MSVSVNKFLVACLGVLAQLQVVIDNGITGSEWIGVGVAAITALGVYAVPFAVTRIPG